MCLSTVVIGLFIMCSHVRVADLIQQDATSQVQSIQQQENSTQEETPTII